MLAHGLAEETSESYYSMFFFVFQHEINLSDQKDAAPRARADHAFKREALRRRWQSESVLFKEVPAGVTVSQCNLNIFDV